MIKIRIGMSKNKSGANVILVKNGKILLLLRSDKSRWMPGAYGPPGGHLDPGESPKQAAVRETYEESGITVKSSDLELLVQRTKHDFGMIYYYITDKFVGNGVALSHEHKGFSWADWERIQELDTTFEPDVLDLIKKHLLAK